MFGGLVQFIGGWIAGLNGNMFQLTAFTSYGAFWIGFAWFNYNNTANLADEYGMRLYFATWGVFTTIMFVASLAAPKVTSVTFFTLALTFFLLSAGEGHASVHKAGGYSGYVCAASCYYTIAAEVINEMYGWYLIPLGRPIVTRRESRIS